MSGSRKKISTARAKSRSGEAGGALTVESWPIDRLKPYERNPRAAEQSIAALAESIRAYGFRQPIVVDGDGVIVCGHARWKAAQRLGLKEVPVHVVHDLTPDQVKAYRLVDNRLSELADWTPELAIEELAGLVTDSGELNRVLSELETELGRLREEIGEDGQSKEATRVKATGSEGKGLDLLPHEHYDYIVILARNAPDWNVLCARLGIRTRPHFARRNARIGICRAVEAEQVLKLLEKGSTG